MTAPATTRDEEFSDFVEQRRGSLQHVAYLLTGDEYRAEDLLQDALVKTWLAWKRIDATYLRLGVHATGHGEPDDRPVAAEALRAGAGRRVRPEG